MNAESHGPAESMSGARREIKAGVSKRKVGKGAWRMPWLTEAMKDAISCDKPWVGANSL